VEHVDPPEEALDMPALSFVLAESHRGGNVSPPVPGWPPVGKSRTGRARVVPPVTLRWGRCTWSHGPALFTLLCFLPSSQIFSL